MRTHSNYPVLPSTQNTTSSLSASQTSENQPSDLSKLPRIASAHVGCIIKENSAAIAPKHIPMATSELIACRAVAILGEHANYLAHIFEWPRGEGHHSTSSMHKMLDKSAQMLGLSHHELSRCEIAVICGSEVCDDIDYPLRQALHDRNMHAEWFDGRHSRGGVYAAVCQDKIGLGHDEMEELRQSAVISEPL